MSERSITTRTAPTLLREAARLINEHGWCKLRGNQPRSLPPGVFGLDLCVAACWAVHGSPCRPRDLDALESEMVAELLDTIEADLGMPVAAYEAKAAAVDPDQVSHDLRLIAWHVEAELNGAAA